MHDIESNKFSEKMGFLTLPNLVPKFFLLPSCHKMNDHLHIVNTNKLVLANTKDLLSKAKVSFGIEKDILR